MFKNWFTTLAGLMAGLGTLPSLATASHIALPLWWNSCQFPLYLCSAVGAILLGLAAKGADEHSTVPQVTAATEKKLVDLQEPAAPPKPPQP